MEFKLKDGEKIRTRSLEKASNTVIPAGSLVALDGNYLAIKAIGSSATVAYCPNGAGSGEAEVEVTVGDDFTLVGTGDANFAKSMRGILCDIVGTTTVLIDVGTASTNVLKISPFTDAGTVGSASNIEVRINKPLF